MPIPLLVSGVYREPAIGLIGSFDDFSLWVLPGRLHRLFEAAREGYLRGDLSFYSYCGRAVLILFLTRVRQGHTLYIR
jgi:hypothetical protein